MEPPKEFIAYERNRFSARFPAGALYTASHFWLLEQEPGLWRVGLTEFATRMIGEIVEFDFEVNPGNSVHAGQLIGWIEGFKAISDLHCPIDGEFHGANLSAMSQAERVHSDPYGRGWLYQAQGVPAGTMDASGYIKHLDQTLDNPFQHIGILSLEFHVDKLSRPLL